MGEKKGKRCRVTFFQHLFPLMCNSARFSRLHNSSVADLTM